jgi:hypothetical protein
MRASYAVAAGLKIERGHAQPLGKLTQRAQRRRPRVVLDARDIRIGDALEPFCELPLREAALIAQPLDPLPDALPRRCHGSRLRYRPRSGAASNSGAQLPALRAFVFEVVRVGLDLFACLGVFEMDTAGLGAHGRDPAHDVCAVAKRHAFADMKFSQSPRSFPPEPQERTASRASAGRPGWLIRLTSFR